MNYLDLLQEKKTAKTKKDFIIQINGEHEPQINGEQLLPEPEPIELPPPVISRKIKLIIENKKNKPKKQSEMEITEQPHEPEKKIKKKIKILPPEPIQEEIIDVVVENEKQSTTKVKIIDKTQNAEPTVNYNDIRKRILESKKTKNTVGVIEPVVPVIPKPILKLPNNERLPNNEPNVKPIKKLRILSPVNEDIHVYEDAPIMLNENVPPIENAPINETEIVVPEQKKIKKPKNILKKPIHKLTKTELKKRLPPPIKITHRVSHYYMNNRKLYIEKINKIFENHRRDILESKEIVSCDLLKTKTDQKKFDLLTHQKIASDYLNLFSPYRGLLLYFGLGSGKSCTSIAIAEGMKSDKQIYIMTPASLKMNYFSELKKCGDALFKKEQYWEFVSIEGHPDTAELLSNALSLDIKYIKSHGGAWLVDINKPSNFADFSGTEQKSIDAQLNEMIRNKYKDINYNGLNKKKISELTQNSTINPFDHSVVIIDEAHNFISRIVNKLNKKTSISYTLYQLLMSATDVRIVLLTGTPIINYPHELGVLFNILRGYIKTWIFTIKQPEQRLNRDIILDMFKREGFETYDYVDFDVNKITITRNPYGFVNTEKVERKKQAPKQIGGKKTKTKHKSPIRKTRKMIFTPSPIIFSDTNKYEDDILFEKQMNQILETRVVPGLNEPSYMYGGSKFEKYNGVKLDETGNINDNDFMRMVVKILTKNGIEVIENLTEIKNHKALPDDKDEFISQFIDPNTITVKNDNLLQRRILGLSSYYLSAQEKLLPRLIIPEEDPDEEEPTEKTNMHIVSCPMSSYQFQQYSEIRKEERDIEKRMKKNAKRNQNVDELFTNSSSYRIFSRSACNFVFPIPPGRPLPDKTTKIELDENYLDAVNEEDEEEEPLNAEETQKKQNYAERIQIAMDFLKNNGNEFLTPKGLETFSPKFKEILENLQDPANIGLHLMYSQFRTIEGIGILQLMLEQNGFERFEIFEKNGEWNMKPPQDISKPRFLLYTGTESTEQKEILRNIYNSQWDVVPPSIVRQLREISNNNFLGEIVKIIMITSSGAEGINLKNTRFVHLVEPYWHMVRLDQVIGRARRICSHQDLPEEFKTVKVFLYITTLTKEQSTSNDNTELIINDVSKLDKNIPLTTDEHLYEISRIKQNIQSQLLQLIKQTSVDCAINSINNKGENLVCFNYGQVKSNDFGSYPSLEEDEQHREEINVVKETIKMVKFKFEGKEYAVDRKTNIAYDMESYLAAKEKRGILNAVGKAIIDPTNKKIKSIEFYYTDRKEKWDNIGE